MPQHSLKKIEWHTQPPAEVDWLGFRCWPYPPLPLNVHPEPRPSAKQITRAEVILELWYKVALNDKGDRKRPKRTVYLKASGMRPRVVWTKTGLNYQQLWKAQKDACSDLWEIILQLSQLKGLIKRETILRFWIELETVCPDPIRTFLCTARSDTHWVVPLFGGSPTPLSPHIFFAMIKRSTTADKYRKLYSTKQWRNLHGTTLTRGHYRCQRCGVSLNNGKSQPTSAVVHHKKPHKGDLTF